MKYETLEQALEGLRNLEETSYAYNHALGVLYLDASSAAPAASEEGRGKTIEILGRITYELLANPENAELLGVLEAHREELDPKTRRIAEVLRREYDKINRITPPTRSPPPRRMS